MCVCLQDEAVKSDGGSHAVSDHTDEGEDALTFTSSQEEELANFFFLIRP